ncbi:MAG: DUF4398 domain-containing protein [Myxococcota bacterium]
MTCIQWRTLLVATATPFAVACGGAAVSTAQVADTQAAVRAAEEGGAEQHPTSAYHLELARKQMQRAQVLIEEDEGTQAQRALDRAQLDAEVALQRARSAQARQRAKRALDRLEELRNDAQSSARVGISAEVGS